MDSIEPPWLAESDHSRGTWHRARGSGLECLCLKPVSPEHIEIPFSSALPERKKMGGN